VYTHQVSREATSSVQTVAAITDLRAVTLAERERARYFAKDGLPPLIESKSMYLAPAMEVLTPSPPGQPVDPDQPLKSLVCSAAAIVVGQVERKRALLNKDESFLFTDHQIRVSQWIRPGSGKPTILVSSLGGSVRVGSTTLEARTDSSVEVGRAYLFFLGLIPRGEAYEPASEPRPVAAGKIVGGVQGNEGLKESSSVVAKLSEVSKECKGG
jgi:hypothetical protein